MSEAYRDESRWASKTQSGPDDRLYGDGYYHYERPSVDIHMALEPLLEKLAWYDTLRLSLETQGGDLTRLEALTASLNDRIETRGRYDSHACALTDQQNLRAMLADIGDYNLHLGVRTLAHGLPAYYLCRTRKDYWGEYHLVVEDLYTSPGYPMADSRFVKLMYRGHESFFLRLSPFREAAADLLGDAADPKRIDSYLYDLGRHIFQAAWHEDQRPGILTADHFGLDYFRQAIELLYLCLSGELCELRGKSDERWSDFFAEIYPQPAIRNLLTRLQKLEGSSLDEIPQQALKLYAQLTRAFGEFLKTDIIWGSQECMVPLYKPVFGNIHRLDQVAVKLRRDKPVVKAARALEDGARAILEEILEPDTHIQ